MMRVKVEYLGTVKAKLNKNGEEIEVPKQTTLWSLLNTISNKYGDWFRNEVFELKDKKIKEGLIVTINGIAAGQTGGLNTILRTEDVVAILPLFAGGG
jgi:molybdopterin converting factor small subunit